MELKKVKNVLYLIVVGLLNLCARVQSDVTCAERRGVFGDLRLCRFLQSGEEENLSLRAEVLVRGCRLPSFDLAPLLINLSFIAFLFSNRIKLGFLCFLPRRPRIGRKITFNYCHFLTNFIDISLCADPMRKPPFFDFEESLSTDNIR